MLKKRYFTYFGITIYIIGLMVFGYFFIRLNYFSQGEYSGSDTINQLRSLCIRLENPQISNDPRPRDYLISDFNLNPPKPECLLSIANVYFFRKDVFWDISEVYAEASPSAFRNGEIFLWLTLLAKSIFYYSHYIIIYYFPFILFVQWTITGLYILTYDHIPDIQERALEGLGAGIYVSTWSYYARMFNWHDFGYKFNLTSLLIWLTGVVIFLSVDIRKKQFDNLFTKIILFFVGILALFLLNFSFQAEIEYFFVPVITTGLAIFYHYWRNLENKRIKAGSLAYSIAFLGLIAAVIKNQDIFLSNAYGRVKFSSADLSEFFLDLVVLALGMLLTYMELNKPADKKSAREIINYQEKEVTVSLEKEKNEQSRILITSQNSTRYFSHALIFFGIFIIMLKWFKSKRNK